MTRLRSFAAASGSALGELFTQAVERSGASALESMELLDGGERAYPRMLLAVARAATRSLHRPLLAAGAHIREWGGSVLHAKVAASARRAPVEPSRPGSPRVQTRGYIC